MRFFKRKKLIPLLTIMTLSFSLLISYPTKTTADDWASWDIRTELAEGITADSINEMVEKTGGSNSWLAGIGEGVIDAGQANGINAAFIMAQLIKESGWKDGNAQVREANNFGNVTGTGNDGSWADANGRKWAKFKTKEDGLKSYAELLKRYTEGELSSKKGQKLTTMQQVIEVYAPPSENDVPKYISDVASLMQKFGQGYDGSIMVGSGEYAEGESKGEKAGDKTKGLDLFLAKNVATNTGTGTSVGEVPVGADIGNQVTVFSEGTKDSLLVVGWILSSILLLYMSISVLLYVIAVKGLATGVAFEKMSGIKDPLYDRSTIQSIFIRLVIGLSIIAFFGTGVYINAMSFVIQAVAKIPFF